MLGQVHDHIVSELGESSRTDVIFVLTAIVFNLIVLAINSGLSFAATEEEATTTYDLVLAVFVVLTVLVNIIAVVGLVMGRRTRSTLLGGLVSMYRDNDVDKYYDPSLISNYRVRYLLFTGAIVTLAVTAIAVPLIIRFNLNLCALLKFPGVKRRINVKQIDIFIRNMRLKNR